MLSRVLLSIGCLSLILRTASLFVSRGICGSPKCYLHKGLSGTAFICVLRVIWTYWEMGETSSCAILEKKKFESIMWQILSARVPNNSIYWAKRQPAYITVRSLNNNVPFPFPLKSFTLIVRRLSSCTIIVMLPVCFLPLSQKDHMIFSNWNTVDKITTATCGREWEDCHCFYSFF